ncbi:hypothetical protein Daura_38700 [Dactylosporangium aurantiacum]|uniref:Ribbon-helix-helix protein CopG domain-containing protein n=1 Tax=Dactylosporangium aurantiacum TaxID=35754 RepID=A0A9Q9I9V6_9ACTN|nr:hypothetical protein [Dactylosporangium aurantiacum]MDG6101647.1 hypothetical protein [Dactylosporangium aurantiacum]UWZ52529.1 hypothetical protein Daura_38700 [Dactylosporangium aurantiacum]
MATPIPECIPSRRGAGGTTQLVVQLPDDLVRYIDAEVAAGTATSRAGVVSRALEGERRQREAGA